MTSFPISALKIILFALLIFLFVPEAASGEQKKTDNPEPSIAYPNHGIRIPKGIYASFALGVNQTDGRFFDDSRLFQWQGELYVCCIQGF